ncbi:hypothetical protein DBR42_03620, partial [Pelomonas sp. HMWF004]
MAGAAGFIGSRCRLSLTCGHVQAAQGRMKQCVVIGGGVVGLTTAWALLERGHSVTLIEQAAEVAQG